MSKTLAISDLHGRSFPAIYYQMTALYKDIDNVVQLGDWFDTEVHAYSAKYQLSNFYQMIKIKKNNDNVHLLIGNHDAAYLFGGELYSIRCYGMEDEIRKAIEDNIQLIDYCYYDNKYLYSHAGISKTLLNDFNFKSSADLNEALHNKDYKFLKDSKASLLYSKFNKVDDYYTQWNDFIENKASVKQVIGHYSGMGMQVLDDVFDIEDFKHANTVLFQ